jgi:pimeloyl-ACP methyl ester carboxylesterase
MPPDAIRGCREALQQRADLRLYTTGIIARDLDEIRHALGIERWNVFGTSYGTRLAQEYTRRFRSRVRTLTLHGVAAPSMAIPLPYAPDAQRAVNQLFDEPAREALRAVLGRLSRAPVVVPTAGGDVAVSAGGLSEALRHMLYNARSAEPARDMILSAAAGDYRAAAEQVLRQRRAFSGEIAFGMFLSVTCTEDIPRISEAAIVESSRGTFLGDYRVRQQMTACAQWTAGTAAPDAAAPLRSDVPALLISGEVDPVTPPRMGEEVARTLPNAHHLVLPGHGHTLSIGQPCVGAAFRRFLETANARELDLSCIGHP